MKFNTKYKIEKCPGTHFNKPSLTDQSQAYDADINNIVNSMAFTNVQPIPPTFGQTFNANMFNDALNTVASAKSQFEQLPAKVRREFNNDIGKFMEFIDSPTESNCKKGVELGIYNKEILNQFKTTDIITDKPTTNAETVVVTGDSSQ